MTPLFFLIPILLLSADDGTVIPVYYTDEIELMCNHSGNVSACVMDFAGYISIIVSNPKQIIHEMAHINGVEEQDIPDDDGTWIPKYMQEYLNKTNVQ